MSRNILVLSLVLGLILGGSGAAYAVIANDTYQHDHIVMSPKVCGDQLCSDNSTISGNMTHDQRNQIFSHISINPHSQYSGNYFIQILKTPAGAQLDNFVINSTDLVRLQNDVGFFTVCGAIQDKLCQPPVPTLMQVTNNFCQLALMIHLNEDGYDNYTVGNSTIFQVTTPPAYCSITPVPEFGALSLLVMSVAIITIISFSALYNKTR